MVLYVWQYDVPAHQVKFFSRHHGPGGAWDQFFGYSRGYQGSTLLRSENGSSMISLDRWAYQDWFNRHIHDPHFEDEFKALCAANERAIPKNQRHEVGWFELSRSYQFGDGNGTLRQLLLLHPGKGKDAKLEALVRPQGPIFDLYMAGSPRFKGTTLYFGEKGLLLEQLWALRIEGMEPEGIETYEIPQVTEVALREIRGLCRSHNPIEDFGTFTKVLGDQDSSNDNHGNGHEFEQ